MPSLLKETEAVYLKIFSFKAVLFRVVHEFYKPIHTYLSIFMCIVGALSNFCNIVILTRLASLSLSWFIFFKKWTSIDKEQLYKQLSGFSWDSWYTFQRSSLLWRAI